MGDYITTAELDRFLLGASAADSTKKSFAVSSASRLFDRLCNVADDYFAAAGLTPSNKVIIGTGATLLKLPPFVGTLGTVTYEDGTTSEEIVDADDFIIIGNAPNKYLETYRRKTLSGFDYLDFRREFDNVWGWYHREVWILNRNYTVSARWGFAAIPDDVKAAVLQIAIGLMSNVDTAKAERLESKTHDQSFAPAGSIAAEVIRKYSGQMIAGFGI